MEPIWGLLNSVGVVGALVVAILAYRRATPKPVWDCVESRYRVNDDESVDWVLKIVLKGSAIPTDVKLFDAKGTLIDEWDSMERGDSIERVTRLSASDLVTMRDPFIPKNVETVDRHNLTLTWRQLPHEAKVQRRTYRARK